jgi:hypothetical protein
MESDRKASRAICITAGLAGKWDVSEKGFEEPLASFDDKEDAYAYAARLAESWENTAVLVEDEEGFSPLPPQDRENAGHVESHRRHER